MLSLREYRNKADRLADFLPWAALVAPGVVLNKDGSFQRTARFRGPDLDSSTPAELVATTARLNSALRRLGSGWSIFVEAVRRPALDYPVCAFPDPASAILIGSASACDDGTLSKAVHGSPPSLGVATGTMAWAIAANSSGLITSASGCRRR